MTTKALNRKIKFSFVLISLLLLLIAAISFYYILLAPNVRLQDQQKEAYLYIHDNDSFEDVVKQLTAKEFLLNTGTFATVAKALNYTEQVRPGGYKVKEGMSNLTLVRKLRNGLQDPVHVTFNNIRTKEQLAARLSDELMADSASIIELLTDNNMLAGYGLTTETAVSVFIPNTYEFFWDTDARELFERMIKEYDRFWTEERKARAASIPLTRTEVITLASIVEEESNKRHELSIIAGLYINRLKIGMPLQADPTVRFAINDFKIKRVLFGHLKAQSPYNTYVNKGLPPGPIRLPLTTSIDAVLNYAKHDFLFMSAKETFNGEHNFAKSHSEHVNNARKYRRALDARGIR